ncbi:hypothetical protein ACKZDW_09350 [Ralstonia syzygii subsp. celebesensis]|uniref:Uncharacterized protein n=3 Tax=Ralstonia solanacearum species complex TaxID=3116862 RepID=A0AAD0WGC1_RALSL|nr:MULTISPECIES: hypothetical protein [Ralstonia solanacearum species complex]CCA79128.1 conserved hypothetical protein [blood disease bacterium R229]AQW31412.1 hypothetical protein B0B51_01790 [blood disease bacterium A2-HR MARDI]AXV81844.1 hypothetical protein CJO77_09990 [Ralstonia solanacearum]AXW52978.1 hypothetical protein CJO92_09985 [Ralstonia solanacearum]QQV54575.1 hypothetical protein JK151_10335 [Ralstonia syzygii subsp. celebesensis]
MQTQKLRQRFEHAEHTIAELAQACATHENVPDALKQSIQQLDEQARQYHARLDGAKDEQPFVEAIDKLEAASDRAKTACQNAGKVDHTVQTAVMRAHAELSQLKHRLH